MPAFHLAVFLSVSRITASLQESAGRWQQIAAAANAWDVRLLSADVRRPLANTKSGLAQALHSDLQELNSRKRSNGHTCVITARVSLAVSSASKPGAFVEYRKCRYAQLQSARPRFWRGAQECVARVYQPDKDQRSSQASLGSVERRRENDVPRTEPAITGRQHCRYGRGAGGICRERAAISREPRISGRNDSFIAFRTEGR